MTIPRYDNSHLDDLEKWLRNNSAALNERARFQGIPLAHQQRWSLQEHHIEVSGRDDAEDARREETPVFRGFDDATGIPHRGEF